MIKVGIVDDHAIVRAGLRDLLATQPDIALVQVGENGHDAVDMAREHELDVLVMDLMMPVHSGIDAIASIRTRADGPAVLIYSGYPEQYFAPALLRKGAQAYVHKQSPLSDLLAAIRSLAAGRPFITPTVADLLLDPPECLVPHQLLSPREFQVFMKLAQGTAPAGIASTLSLSVKTVSTYRSRVMSKMKLHSISDLTYYAIKSNLLA